MARTPPLPLLLLALLLACGGRPRRVERVVAHEDVALLPVERIADLHGPTAVRLEGASRRLPVWLHADRSLEFTAVAGRCSNGECEVEYHEDDDRFVCSCTGAVHNPDGTAVEPGRPGLVTYPVLYRDRAILVELRPAR